MNLESHLKIYRLSHDEYEKICEVLGRKPQGVEWALFSALWSEHCSYKSSKIHLKKFFSKSDRVLESFGENAGVVDLGQGERVAFKMESHNHPSFIEPYQGAATGVGGILRDIFTMGARPIALANYLCFGSPKASRMSALVDGVVRGIGGYGNCVGVPTVTGQTEFHSSYNGNILVNAMAVGLFRPGEEIFTSKARGVGNYVVYVGAKTGRDGVHGASMASESFDEESESKKPTVQIGDPFFEKLLIESCIEVMKENLVEAIQDMGAAGLTSSSFEMASKGGVGFSLDLSQVPVRDATMTPEDILLSESQERMLLICRPENWDRIQHVFEKWDLDAAKIGHVIEDKNIELYWNGECICRIDPEILVDKAPQYERAYSSWTPLHRGTLQENLPVVSSVKETLIKCLESSQGTTREWIYDQYDQRVGGQTARDCTSEVAVLRLPDSQRALSISLGCRPYLMRWDAEQGAMDSIFYPSLQMAAKGFEALAVTDCLNFGNPQKPEVMTEFVASVEGMDKACRAINTPVISGNVSLYNETLGVNVTSTPSTGLIGLRNSLENIPSSHFCNEGDAIYLLSLPQVKLLGLWGELENQEPLGEGQFQAKEVSEFINLVRRLSLAPGVQASRCVGKMGMAYALARMSTSEMGCNIQGGTWLAMEESPKESLFVETAYQVLFVIAEKAHADWAKLWSEWRGERSQSQLWRLGETLKNRIHIEELLDVSTQELNQAYKQGWEKHFVDLA